TLVLGQDAVVLAPVNARVDAPIVFVGEGKPAELEGLDLRGKVVAAVISDPGNLPPPNVGFRQARYAFSALGEQGVPLASRGAALVMLISNPVADSGWGFAGTYLHRGGYQIDTTRVDRVSARVPVVWARARLRELLSRSGQRLEATLIAEDFVHPSVNVVARVRGGDPRLREEYLLFSGHLD